MYDLMCSTVIQDAFPKKKKKKNMVCTLEEKSYVTQDTKEDKLIKHTLINA
jgi:hypothetical protein